MESHLAALLFTNVWQNATTKALQDVTSSAPEEKINEKFEPYKDEYNLLFEIWHATNGDVDHMVETVSK